MFVPLAHAPGHAQADFGEAMVVIGGVEAHDEDRIGGWRVQTDGGVAALENK